MKRFETTLTITFTTDATSKVDARKRFIMRVINHLNLETGGAIKIDMSDEEFQNWNKNTGELPF